MKNILLWPPDLRKNVLKKFQVDRVAILKGL